jgi:hypothetical protein
MYEPYTAAITHLVLGLVLPFEDTSLVLVLGTF